MPEAIRLKPADAERYARLRRRMLEDAPWSFIASPEDDPTVGEVRTRLAEETNAIFAVEKEAGGALIAAAGVVRLPRAKLAHRAIIWGVFVEPAHRRAGLGRLVTRAAIDLARSWPGVDWVALSVSENASAAQRLYESMGFVTWGREPEAIEWLGCRYDETHMSLRL